MTEHAFGPVELFVLSFPEPGIPEGVRSAVADVMKSGAVTLLDLAVVRRAGDGIEILELDTVGDDLRLIETELSAQGLIGEEDLEEIAADVPADGAVVVFAIEHTWARQVVGAVFAAGATVIATERIPADVVNEVADLAELPEPV